MLYRKVIRIRAEDSPNVRFAQWQLEQGIEPTNEIIVPGVLSWSKYCERRALWNPQRQAVSLDAEFWEGKDTLLWPEEWLNRAVAMHYSVHERVKKRQAKGLGIDTGEGQANTAWTVVDDFGVMEQVSYQTQDTSLIEDRTIQIGREYNLDPSDWMFDSGGGGHQIADYMRKKGYPVRTVGFGEGVLSELKTGMSTLEERKEAREERYVYKNRRAQMYGEASALFDPVRPEGFALPPHLTVLRDQLAMMPLLRDSEGRLYLPPKTKRPGFDGQTLEDIIGHSPDEADSLVIAVHAMLHKTRRVKAGTGRKSR